jgi:hypothetical protein
MTAAATDKLRKVVRRFATTLTSGINQTDVTIPCASLTGVPTDTAVTVTIDRVDGSGTKTLTKEEVVTGVVSSSDLVTCTRGVAGTAQAHSTGAVVEIMWVASVWNDAVDAILAEHNQSGGHTTDTIAEKTSGAGVTVDGLLIRDGGIRAHDWTQEIATATRTGNHVFTLAGDQTDYYRKGTRVRYKDGGAFEYGVVVSAAYSSVTTVTLATNTDYTMAGNPTELWFSNVDNPAGYPNDFTWEPTVSGQTDAGSGTYSVQAGKFSIRGRSIKVIGNCIWSNHTGTGNLIFNLPVKSRNVTNLFQAVSVHTNLMTLPANTVTVTGLVVNNTSTVRLYGVQDGGAHAQVAVDTAAEIYVSSEYIYE